MVDAQRIFRQHMIDPEPCPWRWRREGDDLPALRDDGVPSYIGADQRRLA